MYRRLVPLALLVFAGFWALPLIAQGRPGPAAPFSEAEAHKPSPLPDRIILTWQGDPARSQSVTWRTDRTVGAGLAQILKAVPGPIDAGAAHRVPAVTTLVATDLGAAHYHTARMLGLEPATRYAYRVGDGVNWSEWLQFSTAAAGHAPFSFIYFGDAQNDIKSHWSRVIREAFSDAPRARFIIHAGDLINRANRDAEWGEWFAAGGWINGMVPSIPTPGNHEYAPDTEGRRRVSGHWRPQFALPENGPVGLEETCYYVDYQGARIISLNSNERQAEQVAWLDRVLSDNPHPWTVATFHHPIYSTARGRDNAELRRLWNPVLEKHRVDLVLQGHDHTYARSNLNTGMSASEARSGTVYVVSVSGPKMYNLERQPWMRRAAEDTQLYQVVSVDGERLRYEARTADGRLYDAFELRKRKNGPNRMRDEIPNEVPERRRPAVK